MPEPAVDLWLAGVVIALAAGSLVTWAVVLSRPRPLLPYAPRRPVPWGGTATLLAVFFVAMVIVGRVFGGESADELPPGTLLEHVQQLGLDLALKSAIVAAVLAAVIAVSRAKLPDLGLPEFVDDLVGDVKLGVVAWLAAIVPVYGLQAMLVAIFGEPVGHPLIQMMQREPHPMLFVLAFAVAVIAAPICEEIAFRLLLQGWLEKWEDARLGWRAPAESDAVVVAEPIAADAVDSRDTASETVVEGIADDAAPSLPPRRGLMGLPHGWLPILISSLLFALAHFGYGPDPIPLFFLAIVLGYVYQRTHRIVPCMVAHALFNLVAVVALWRMAYGPANELGP